MRTGRDNDSGAWKRLPVASNVISRVEGRNNEERNATNVAPKHNRYAASQIMVEGTRSRSAFPKATA